MPDFRCFAPEADPHAREISLHPDESHHLVRVNRVKKGDPVTVFNGKGDEWVCECLDPDRRHARLLVCSHSRIEPTPYRITLAQSLPKGKTFDQIIRQATELGVARIVPLISERTEVHLDGERLESKHGKWETTAIEAAKQSGNAFLPEIAPARTLTELLSGADEFDLRLIASLHPGAGPLRPAVDRFFHSEKRLPARPVWLVGPEGDFTPAEIEAATAAGFAPITLGRQVLRCDTAANYAVSILSYELEQARDL